MRRHLWIFCLAAGCGDLDPGLDLGPTPEVRLYDDGTTLVITGCPGKGLFGCSTPYPGQTMTAIVDGTYLDVPPLPAPQLFPEEAFSLGVPTPVDPVVGVEIVNVGVDVTLLDRFAVMVPGQVVRSAGAVAVRFEPLDGAGATLSVTSQCGAVQEFQTAVPTAPGRASIVLDATVFGSLGSCVHELGVEQTVGRIDDTWGISVAATRRVLTEFTSDP